MALAATISFPLLLRRQQTAPKTCVTTPLKVEVYVVVERIIPVYSSDAISLLSAAVSDAWEILRNSVVGLFAESKPAHNFPIAENKSPIIGGKPSISESESLRGSGERRLVNSQYRPAARERCFGAPRPAITSTSTTAYSVQRISSMRSTMRRRVGSATAAAGEMGCPLDWLSTSRRHAYPRARPGCLKGDDNAASIHRQHGVGNASFCIRRAL